MSFSILLALLILSALRHRYSEMEDVVAESETDNQKTGETLNKADTEQPVHGIADEINQSGSYFVCC